MRKAWLGLTLLALSGCSPADPGWVTTDGLPGRAAAELAACRRWADNRLDPDRGAEDRLAAGSPLAADDRERLRRDMAALVAGCMQDRGYRPDRPARR